MEVLHQSPVNIICKLEMRKLFFTKFAFPQLPPLWSGRYIIFLSSIYMIQEIKEKFFLKIELKTSNICVPSENSCFLNLADVKMFLSFHLVPSCSSASSIIQDVVMKSNSSQ